MSVLISEEGNLISVSGYNTGLRKPSVPLNAFGAGSISLTGAGRTISYASLYRTQPWVAVAVNKLARQIARLPMKVYRVDGAGDRERVRDGALADLIRKPWKRGSSNHLKQALGFPTLLHGNSVLAKSRPGPGAPPDTLIPLDWRYLRPLYTDGSGIEAWLTTQFGKDRYLPPEDVVHTAWWSPEKPFGISPLEQLGVSLRLEEASQRYATNSFQNAVRPSGALVAPPEAKLSREDRADLKNEIQSSHGGVDNAFQVMLLSGGLDWKPFSQTAKEAELIQQRLLNREEVAAVYDIPPPLIGILEHATYSNVSEMHRMLYMTVLGPWLDLIEQTLQAQLIDSEPAYEGLFVEFDLSEVLKGDTKERIESLKTAVGSGIYTLNEARKIENLPRYDNDLADQALIPTNNLGPLGAEAPAEDPLATIIASHVARARDRVASRNGAGVADTLDRDRFERELRADLEPLTEAAAHFAKAWAETLAGGLAEAETPKAFFDSLT